MAVLDFQKNEKEILEFWEQERIFEKSLELRHGKKRFVFFEGPPTANAPPGIHHFIGRAYKDLFPRYKTMRGFYVLRKAGWDTHGLPVELQIEKALGFKNKKQIEEYGIAAFNKKAKESVWGFKKEWETLTKRMGFWVDTDNPYITYDNKYIESLWWIINKVWNDNMLYTAHKVVPFCVRCGTPLSAHEVAQGYKKVTDKSVTVKFKVKNPKFKNTFLLAWTTTPWTLPGNVALAVGADFKYQVVSIKGKDEKYILAQELVSKVLNTEYIIHDTISGQDLVGLEYEPLVEIPALKSAQSYKIYPANFVSTSEGTGVVHTAVMYGEDDYDLGTQVGLPKVHTVSEEGLFVGVGDGFDGLYAKNKTTEEKILAHLQKNGNLFKTEDYEHDYPFCWRCETPLLYYAKNSWFIRMSALREKMSKANDGVNWIPEHIREGRFGQWVKDAKDWAFSRERYWGTPLPIWKCIKCGEYKAIDSIKEIKRRAVSQKNKYYLLRHGATSRNEEGDKIVSSRVDIDKYSLTPDAKQSLEDMLTKFKAVEEIDEIYASPFLRTQETAQIAARVFHKEIKTDDRLGEIVHSIQCEGKRHSTCPVADKRFMPTEADEENWDDVRKRLMNFIGEVESSHQGKRIMIVSHGDPLWLFDNMSQGLDKTEITAYREANKAWFPRVGELKKIEWPPLPRNELGELDLHRPFIDEVLFKCPKCRAEMHRIPELTDVWFDSGSMPYAQWHLPFEGKKIFKQQFPADFITEAIDQTRGWFYTLLAVSTLLDKGAPYKNVLCYSHVLDEKGQKMSKSKGNVVSPFEVMDRFGADTGRWYFYTLNAPGDSKLFSFHDLEERLKGFMMTLENCVKFYELYASQESIQEPPATTLLDKWIISKLHGLIRDVSERLDHYDPTTSSRAIENFVINDFSQWWLRRSRKRAGVLPLLRSLLLEIAKISAPFIPFTAENIYRRLGANKTGPESIHLTDWPQPKKKFINPKLEEKMAQTRNLITAGLAMRKEKQIKVRQPLKSVTVSGAKLESDLQDLLKEELNIKEVIYKKEGELELDIVITPALAAEGYAREMMRQIQDLRKEAKYQLDEKVLCQWHSDNKILSDAINVWAEDIKSNTLLSTFVNGPENEGKYDIAKNFELAPQMSVWIGIKK